MNRTLQIARACVFALVLAAGCRQYRTREFVAVQHPGKFENWRLYVNAHVDAANPAPTNHFYLISAVAWTAPGDSVGGNPKRPISSWVCALSPDGSEVAFGHESYEAERWDAAQGHFGCFVSLGAGKAL